MSKDKKNTLAYEPNNVLSLAIEPEPEMGIEQVISDFNVDRKKAMQDRVTIESVLKPTRGVVTMELEDSDGRKYAYHFTPVADPIGGGGTGQDIANLYNLITNEAEQRARI